MRSGAITSTNSRAGKKRARSKREHLPSSRRKKRYTMLIISVDIQSYWLFVCRFHRPTQQTKKSCVMLPAFAVQQIFWGVLIFCQTAFWNHFLQNMRVPERMESCVNSLQSSCNCATAFIKANIQGIRFSAKRSKSNLIKRSGVMKMNEDSIDPGVYLCCVSTSLTWHMFVLHRTAEEL